MVLDENAKVYELLLEDGNWNPFLVRTVLDEEGANLALNIPIAIGCWTDVIVWNLTNSGLYSMRSGTDWLLILGN